MASILSVGEIQGLQENSNTITVPSGHTLEVSDIVGISGANIRNVIDYSYSPPNWAYTNSSQYGAWMYSTTFTLAKRSLLICSSTGHVYNTAGNTVIAISIDNDKPGLQYYPYYKGDAYYTNGANANTWSAFHTARYKELAAGSHTVALSVGGDGGTHTNYVNGSDLRIFALELM